MISKLSAQEITKLLADNAVKPQNLQIIVMESLASTNDHLLELVSKSAEQLPKTALLAEMQSAGKGRQGRQWLSVEGNILLSLYWPFNCTLDKLYGLSLVVGIAIARVLKANGLHDVQLKWPNDIYWHDRKMGGILIETKQNREGIIDTIIGIGLNIVDMDEYSAKINQKVVALESALQHKVYRDRLVAQLLAELDSVISEFTQSGFNAFIEEWKKLDCKVNSNSQDLDLFAKIINAEKIKHDLGGGKLH